MNFDAEEEGDLEFFDISRKKILETQVLAGSNTIVSKNIAKGVCFGRFITKNGNEETHKIMIK